MYGYLTFPEECHPGDAISHTLLIAAEPEGIHLNYFKFDIVCNTSSGQKTLHNETIENRDLPETWILNETARLTIPSDAFGRVYCTIAAETYRQFTASDSAISLCTTCIRAMNYEEVETAYQELQSQYNTTIQDLKHWMTKYQELNDTYLEVLGSYNATAEQLEGWKNEYQTLNSTYCALLSQQNATLEQLNFGTNEYGRLNSTYSQLQNSYASLNSSYGRLQIDYDSLKSSFDSLEASYDSLNASYNSVKNDYDPLETSHNDLLEKYDSLNSTYQELNINFTGLTLGFEELERNLSLIQAKYDNLSSSYNSLNSTYYSLLEEYQALDPRNTDFVREFWTARALWFNFLVAAIAAIVYVVYSEEKGQIATSRT